MTLLAFRAALVSRDLDVLTLSVVPRGCHVLGGEYEQWTPDRAAWWKTRPGERVLVLGPSIVDDHAGAIVVDVEPLVVQLTYGAIGTVTGVAKMLRARAMKTARAA